MWSSSRPALPSRPCDTTAAPTDWDSLLPLLPESVRHDLPIRRHKFLHQ